MSLSRVLLVAALLLTTQISFAGMTEDLADLKDIPRSYEDSGAICEEVARLELRREFPSPTYDIAVGIEYGDGMRTIGELDVVIIDKNINRVVKVAEVKCWKDMRAGLAKAKDQRARFIKTLRSSRMVEFRPLENNQGDFNRGHFEMLREFIAIGPKGSLNAGYDVELAYDLRTLHNMRSEMLRCQSFGGCARP